MLENNINDDNDETLRMAFTPKDHQPPFTPKGGWNPAFSQKDRQHCTDYYEYITPIHGPIIAEMMSQMLIYKEKFHLQYSEEQEQKLADVFCYSFGNSINPSTVIKNKMV